MKDGEVSGLLFAALRRLNVERVPFFGHTLEGWNPLEWAGALCGEAGEAANIAKKLRRRRVQYQRFRPG